MSPEPLPETGVLTNQIAIFVHGWKEGGGGGGHCGYLM